MIALKWPLPCCLDAMNPMMMPSADSDAYPSKSDSSNLKLPFCIRTGSDTPLHPFCFLDSSPVVLDVFAFALPYLHEVHLFADGPGRHLFAFLVSVVAEF